MAKIIAQHLVHLYHLSVGLGIREVQHDLRQATKCTPKCGSELNSPISDNVLRQSMQKEDMVENVGS